MTTFLIGLVMLVVGGALYGRFTEKVFAPDDRPTPATSRNDGVDYVPMKQRKNALIELLNIAGTDQYLDQYRVYYLDLLHLFLFQ